MNEQFPEQENEHASEAVVEHLPPAEESGGVSHESDNSGEHAPDQNRENAGVRDHEREQALNEIKTSIAAETAPAEKTAPEDAEKEGDPADAEKEAGGGGGGKFGRGLKKAFKFMGRLMQIGFLLTVAAGSSLVEKAFSKVKMKGGGGGGGHSKGHSAPKGGGHAAKSGGSHGGGHGGGGGHH